jgi:hypothetical protein
MEFEIFLQNERNKCIKILKEYNTKYDTEEQKKLETTLEYLQSVLDSCDENYMKILLMDDIKNIKDYLYSKQI